MSATNPKTPPEHEIKKFIDAELKKIREEIERMLSTPIMSMPVLPRVRIKPITIWKKELKDEFGNFSVFINFDPCSFVIGITHLTLPGLDASVMYIYFLPLFCIGFGFQSFEKGK